LITLNLILATTAADAAEMKRFNETDGQTRALLERMADGMGGVHALTTIATVRSFARIEQNHREEEDPIAIEVLSSFPGRHRARVLTEQGTMTITISDDDAYILPARSLRGRNASHDRKRCR
jgi:hypothetical protein